MKKVAILLTVVMSFAMVSTLSAQGLGLNSIGAKAGIILPEDPWDTGFYGGVVADMGELTENLGLVPFATYWKSNYSISGYDLGLSNIQIGADVHYYLPGAPGLYLGGGLSLNFLSVEYPTFDYVTYSTSTTSESETKFGFGFLAGFGFNIGNQSAFVEGKYNIISDLNTIELALGILFDMGK
ncbi:MAG TPA: hypothetical protein ENK44_04130 [Caldithrix abyssi]|uniref:Outer membrane protein beta-barrel domain-containing protein n=1 Tax=Caldithrix abyssi TaxID=187145 RepID=A0A7V4TYQ6_CALAY|nr:hypothetical protein [Caldithrix abyssi]